MDREKIKETKHYDYKTHNSTGRMKVAEVYKTAETPEGKKGGGSWWVVGFDKTKNKNVKVRPSQIVKP